VFVVNKKNIGIIFGGSSTEHEVSIITGLQVLHTIDNEKYNAIPIYVSKDGAWYTGDKLREIETFKTLETIPQNAHNVQLIYSPDVALVSKRPWILGPLKIKKYAIDVFFPCFHGGFGENGAFQGLFDISGVPYVGSGVLGSALGMDKVLAKKVYDSSGVHGADYQVYSRQAINENSSEIAGFVEEKFNYPVFVKPAVGGSSVGVSKAKNTNELLNALELAAVFDSRVLVEQGIENAKEINISVVGNSGSELMTSACEEVFHAGDFLTYDDKYKGGSGKSQGMASTKRKVPADLTDAEKTSIEQIAKKVFESLTCFGLARIDFLVKKDTHEVFVIEINTIPGSYSFYLWEAVGLKFKDLISKLIDLAESRFCETQKDTTVFETNILKDFKPGAKNSKLG
jgi:D-alanine-D-alanine ligase